MTVYVDVLIAINIFVNYFLLMCVKKALKINVKRTDLILGAVAGGMYSLVIFLPEIPEILTFLMNMVASLLIVLIAFRPKKLKLIIKCFAVFFGVNFVFAGLMLALWLTFKPHGMVFNNSVVYFNIDFKILVISTIACYFIIILILKLSKRRVPDNKIYSVTLFNKNKTVTVNALLDTGNTLHDPFTGKSVIIIEKSIAEKLFDTAIINFFENGDIPAYDERCKLRLIPVNTVSSEGTLRAAIIDSITINDNRKTLQNVLVAQSKTDFTNAEYSVLLNNDIINERGNDNDKTLF